ncbi:hypothetical protein AB0L65_48870 [Nonomuraea sp. NPDC052116]|uniref:hypothetical protein n=1 Tax=Nonomuraea sp. NPDC052116 TaxID=3155665 RepID=UPI0034495466
MDALVKQFGRIDAGPSTTGRLPAKPRKGALGVAPQQVHARLGAMLAISTDGLPAPLIAALKHLAAFHNPEFYRRQFRCGTRPSPPRDSYAASTTVTPTGYGSREGWRKKRNT